MHAAVGGKLDAARSSLGLAAIAESSGLHARVRQAMMRRKVFMCCIASVGAVTALAVSGCAAPISKIADTLLANEVRFDDRELPQTAYAIPASADWVQLIGGQGSGLSCSLPWGAQTLAFTRTEHQAPIALQMRQACAFHDYCYRHGNATYGYSQADCDYLLQQHAFRICKYVNREASIDKCETDARKLTLGVRVGGFNPFRSARATEDGAASTFLEFDPYPVRSREYQVVRIADAPEEWVRSGSLAKAAYHFDIRPSGSIVSIKGWKKDTGEVIEQDPIVLPGSYYSINVPPMVVREAPEGKDWLVWWKRNSLNETGGRFALLPAGQASLEDWKVVSGETTTRSRPSSGHSGVRQGGNAGEGRPAAFVQQIDAYFTEVHPIQGMNRPGQVRLAAMTKNACTDEGGWTCLVDLELDTIKQTLRVSEAKKMPPMHSARDDKDDKCKNDARSGHCNAYRNHVAAPYVLNRTDGPLVMWLLRGTGDDGRGYDNAAIVRSYAFGENFEATAVKRGDFDLSDFPERLEPAVLFDARAPTPAFLSLEAGKKTFAVHIRSAAPQERAPEGASGGSPVSCKDHADRSWLQRSVAYVQDPNNTRRGYLVFSRVQFEDAGDADSPPSAGLHVAVTTIFDRGCSRQWQHHFPGFFKGSTIPFEDEKNAAKKEKRAIDMNAIKGATFRWFAEKVRGGQLVVADLNADNVPDLLQVTKISTKPEFDTAVLIGSMDSGELRFERLGSASD